MIRFTTLYICLLVKFIDMAKITKKSINTLMDVYKRNSTDTILKLTDPQDDKVVMEIALKTSLTITEKGVFVDRVVLPCFDDNGDFMPQYLDPLFMINLLQMTTNVPVIEDAIPVVDEFGNETGEKSTIIIFMCYNNFSYHHYNAYKKYHVW